MGVSDLDPGAHGRRPWNSGNMVAEQTAAIDLPMARDERLQCWRLMP